MSTHERTLRERVDDACITLFRQARIVALLREQQARIALLEAELADRREHMRRGMKQGRSTGGES